MLLSDAAKSYEADKKIEGFSAQTLNAYRIQAKLLIDYFGNININKITTLQLKNYLAESSNSLKLSSLSHRIRFLRSLFGWLHEEDIIELNPASKTKKPRVGNGFRNSLLKEKSNI
ncbi:hypothetical protein CWR45_18455 [Oceanobacillus chungangensis]|uniref:Core-binding (CB) domain-containing protein n=1 Tax=Oceanobacillus chungangensis TaxID=1229152 RepID=A0A3D8PIY1_9BACI|nr:hypothetical protein CWR45_18455 [Oceanobacillus chungangensis]